MEPTLEERLVNHISETGFDDLDQETVRSCKKLVLDSLGVVFPGSKAPGCPETIDLMRSWRSVDGASVLLQGFSAAPPLAAMTNSMMMHALDFDDTLDASALHAFVNILPAALAAAEPREKVSGKDLITALVLGADVICRLSLAIDRPLSWIRTATCGGFGAAATAGKILGLGQEELSNALGIMYSRTSGNAQGLIEGRLVKRMQPGFAASAGVTSAYLAGRGITGSRLFLTGPYGFYNLYEQGDYDPGLVTEKMGEHFAIVDLSIKPYPSCRMTHSTIEAALKLKNQVGPADQIERVDVSVSSMVAEMVGKPFEIGTNPQVDAQFSIGYTAACALIRGDVFLEDFETDRIMDPEVQRLAERVVVSVNKDIPAKDIFQAEMKVTLKDGRLLLHKVSVPPGNPKDPVTDEQCREKFNKCIDYSGLAFNEQARKELLSMIDDLEHLPHVKELVRMMAG
ncbi:MAG TPA: MmgE/PrpD family protein [Desulfobacteraceae bacterium]|nr:MmgE/PrpD family protein [Desulfobacteraceae bacterium]